VTFEIHELTENRKKNVQQQSEAREWGERWPRVYDLLGTNTVGEVKEIYLIVLHRKG